MISTVPRRATPADLPAILPMVTDICAFHTRLDPARFDYLPDVLDRYESWLPQRIADPRSLLLVADAPHTAAAPPRPVAFLVATTEPNIPIYHTREFAFVHDLWVQPAHRRSGLGRALALEAIAWARSRGLSQLRLETAALNDSARALFTTCGLKTQSIEMGLNL
ncbi:MAG: GNAT family N-acetyltransferase [Phycisphaerales bacterium]|nr:GNAT family N-acetyltransferase [Phycisphaerales bacterium]